MPSVEMRVVKDAFGNQRRAPGGILSRMACSSRVIWRASISIKPEPNMPTVARELAMSCRVIFWDVSFTELFVGTRSLGSNVAKSNRCPSTKTLATMSPPPPGIPKGELWHPAQELESGPEIRLKFL